MADADKLYATAHEQYADGDRNEAEQTFALAAEAGHAQAAFMLARIAINATDYDAARR